MDTGNNSRVTFHIVAGNAAGNFMINHQTGDILTMKSVLALPVTVNLTVSVTDHGATPLSSTGVVHIEPIHHNNSEPVFLGTPYSTNVSEDTFIGTSLFQIMATDSDPQEAGELVYSLSNIPEKSGQAIFKVDAVTGVITLQQPLDYEIDVMYRIIVTATDKHKQRPKSKSVDVAIYVIDVNDNQPVMVLPSRYAFFETGGTNVGVPFLTLNITDYDAGLAGNVSLIMQQGNSTLFGVQEYAYGIYYKHPLDFEVCELLPGQCEFGEGFSFNCFLANCQCFAKFSKFPLSVI